MVQPFIKIPFANTGDVATIPLPAQVDGSVSFEKGFPINYQEDPDTEPTAKDVPRDQFNYLMNTISTALRYLQIHGFPDFIDSTANGGSAYSYEINATVRFVGGWASVGAANYYSLIDANTTDPTNAGTWGLVSYKSFEIPGVIKEYAGTTLPAGYVWVNGTTVGNAASGATGRANADTYALFSNLWNSYPNSTLQIQDGGGNPVARGVSALADFNNNYRMPTPNRMGRASVGLDGMGGASAIGLITLAGCGIDGATMGAIGGGQTVALVDGQNGPHTHSASTDTQGTHYHTGVTDTAGDHTHSGVTDTQGSHTHTLSSNVFVFGGGSGPNNGLGSGNPGSVPGTNTAGSHNHNLGINNNGSHAHNLSINNNGAHNHNVTVSNAGSGDPHNNVQPIIVSTFIIALGTS